MLIHRLRAFLTCLLLLEVLGGVLGCRHDPSEIPPGEIISSPQPHRPTGLARSFQSSSRLVAPETVNPSPPETEQSDWFEDVTAASRISFTYRNGEEGGHLFILESLGGGAAAFDFDRDDFTDIFFTGGGTIDSNATIAGLPSALFRNVSEFHFDEVSAQARVLSGGDYSHGCFAADFDCDGFPDFIVTAYGRCRLFKNLGDGTFIDMTAGSGINQMGWWTAAAWGDINRDGLPDLYLASYLQWSPASDQKCWNPLKQREVCGPNRFPAADDRVYRNLGDGSFEDITESVQVQPGGNGLAVVAADINRDGLVDFYVANDETDNFLYLGRSDGTLQEMGHAVGVAVNQYGTHEGSMGVEAGDYDQDGRCDLWVTNFELEDNALYRNLGDEIFLQTTNTAGLAGRSRLQVGFGTALEDFNGDGRLDLLVINGHVFYGGGQLPYRQKPQLFQNTADGRFKEVSRSAGTYFRENHPGRGATVGDFDNDGGIDVVVVHQNEPVSVLRNRFPHQRFISLDIIGTRVDRDAIGTTVTVRQEGDERVAFVRSGAGYLSHFDRRVVMAVTDAPFDVKVCWTDGMTEIFRAVPTGRTSHLIQGQSQTDAAP